MGDEYEPRKPTASSTEDEIAELEDRFDALTTEYENEKVAEAAEYVHSIRDEDDVRQRWEYLQKARQAVSSVDEGFEGYEELEDVRDELDGLADQYKTSDDTREMIAGKALERWDDEDRGIVAGARKVLGEYKERAQAYLDRHRDQ